MLVTAISMTVTSCGGDDDEPEMSPTLGHPNPIVFNELGGTVESWITNCNSMTSVYSTVSWITVQLDKEQEKYYAQVSKNTTNVTRQGAINLVYCGTVVDSQAVIQEAGSDNPGGGNNPGGDNGGNQGGGNQGGGDNPGGGNGGNTQQKPSAPTGVSVSNEGNASVPDVRVRWNAVSNATTYYVYKSSTANGSYSKIGESAYANYGYCDKNAPTNGASAYYKVKAVNSAGESAFSQYAQYTSVKNDEAFSPAYVYGNCTVSGNTMTLNWTNSTGKGYGKATTVELRVWNPYIGEYQNTKLSATATSASFNFSTKIDDNGFVKAGIVVSNAIGSFTAGAKVYDTKNKKWLN